MPENIGGHRYLSSPAWGHLICHHIVPKPLEELWGTLFCLLLGTFPARKLMSGRNILDSSTECPDRVVVCLVPRQGTLYRHTCHVTSVTKVSESDRHVDGKARQGSSCSRAPAKPWVLYAWISSVRVLLALGLVWLLWLLFCLSISAELFTRPY